MGAMKFKVHLQNFQSLNKVSMWWYNILWDNEGSIPYILWLGAITAEPILITNNLVALKWENPEPILTVKII